MDCFRPPDPSIHHILRVAKITLTFMSIIMAIVTIVIIRMSQTISKEYARLLYIIIILAAFFDVYSQFIFDPQYIMPYLCVYRDAPLFNLPLNPAWGFIIWVTLFSLNIPLYSAAFIHRHQIAWDTHDGWIIRRLSDEWDPSISTRMECMFQYAEIRNIWGASLFLLCLLIATAISLHTFHLIGQTRTLSTTTKSFHRMLMFSLISVAVVPMLFIVAPLSAALFYYLFLFKVYETKVSVMDIANVLFAFHSVIHSLVLIITTPVFRKLFIKIFCSHSTCSNSVAPSSVRYEY